MDGTTTCSRLGCEQLAVAVFGFDARECLVWLDPLDDRCRGAGLLCTVHADRMSPPRGWNLLDRRDAEMRLWIGANAASVAGPAVRGGSASPRRHDRVSRSRPLVAPGPPLPFEAVLARSPVDPPNAPEPSRVAWSPRDRPGPGLDQVLDAHTPLLARAFKAARPADDDS